MLALLLDPDKTPIAPPIADEADRLGVSMLLVGGSEVHTDMSQYVRNLRQRTPLPVVLFPGDAAQFTPEAHAIMLPTLISGRNPNYLIGQHLRSARSIKCSGIEVLPTGYLLIDGGRTTAVQRVSQTQPIPPSDVELAASTAMAGELLGLGLIYLEAGSGALNPVPRAIIRGVRSAVELPLVVGGGLRSLAQLADALAAGADVLVLGNSVEANPDFPRQAAAFMRGRQ